AVVKRYRIITRRCPFVLMVERNFYTFYCIIERACKRHDGDIQPIAYAGATEMHMAESSDKAIAIVIAAAPIPTCASIIRTKLNHSKRDSGSGERMPVSTCSDKGIDIINEGILRLGCHAHRKQP